MVRKTLRNPGLPRDVQTKETVVEIQPLEFPLIAEPACGIMTAFRVDFRGDPESWKSGTIEVTATLIRRTWDEERQTCNSTVAPSRSSGPNRPNASVTRGAPNAHFAEPS